MEQPILTAVHDGYRVVTFNRPDKLNAFTAEMNRQLQAALDAADRDASCRALLITAAGRGFTAGQDLSAIRLGDAGASGPDTRTTLETLYNPIVRRIASLRMPVVAAVNGIAAGAGLNLALGCDVVLAARSAKFLQPFVKIGLVPDAGGTWYLPRLVGMPRAKALAILGETITAEEAERFGMIWKVVEDAALQDEAVALTRRLAAAPTRAIAAIKRTLAAAETNTLDQQLDLERDVQVSLAGTPDNLEGIKAFLEKRAPKFTGS
jgi:2-(1,2-epoxy-1,2-dihydrophenyl)acetyl-CoA isomerase